MSHQNNFHVAPRLIPVLLLEGDRLVKTVRFEDATYIGDPVNVLGIFNDLEVDEIVLINIEGSKSRRQIDLEMLGKIVSECFVPLAFGGGVNSAEYALAVIATGVEKVIVNSLLFDNPDEVTHMVTILGSQAVVAAVDVRKMHGTWQTFSHGGEVDTGLGLTDWCLLANKLGVGEIFVTSIDREGTRSGYDLDLIRTVCQLSSVPVVAHGGSNTREDLRLAVIEAGASAAAAGSQFVFQQGQGSVLVNYPSNFERSWITGSEITKIPDQQPMLSGIGETADPIENDLGALDDSQVCQRCLITTDVPGSQFGIDGVCYYCRLHDSLERQFPLGDEGLRNISKLARRLIRDGKGKPYDCILGVSGGCDSSYLVKLMVDLGVRPLAVHFDNTWNSPIATSNIYSVLNSLNVDLETYVVDNLEYDDIYRSFMLAGVKDVEAPTDIGFMGVLYRAAEKHGIKHIVEGHSFRTEGVSPLGWLYMDGGYIESVHRKFGSISLKTYPNMTFWLFLKWQLLSGIERHRPLYHLDYQKEKVKSMLSKEFGWQWYGGHHLENRFTAFYHSYLLPNRFNIDFRQIEYSALIRSGHLSKTDANKLLNEPRDPDPDLIALVKKRLNFDDVEFNRVMTMRQSTYREFKTYKSRFERLRPFFWVMYKLGRVPRSFYEKFCK